MPTAGIDNQWLFGEPNPSRLKAMLAREGWLADELRTPIQRAAIEAGTEGANLLARLSDA